MAMAAAARKKQVAVNVILVVVLLFVLVCQLYQNQHLRLTGKRELRSEGGWCTGARSGLGRAFYGMFHVRTVLSVLFEFAS